ncbi:hypothetical protein ACBY01_13295 [Sphingomonas sp. ac-8]|uniref:hypothetical protein n=1 Tax=Sphingomonas sp. ac-8 TaxID=3242977 RepID=UPI003A806149
MSVANAKARARGIIFSSEGFIAHFYLDTVSQVTVGYGTMLPNAASTASIEMLVARTQKIATAKEKADEWQAIRALSAAGSANNLTAQAFQRHASLIMLRGEAERLFDLKLNGFLTMLRANYPGFDKFPEDAQVAMLDMAYNLGNRIHTVFRNFTRAVNQRGGPDWVAVAKQSNRPQLSAQRNREVYDLFIGASKVTKP